MKKSLFAVAALTAIAGAAQAQSSVTVYGLLDVGYIGANIRSNTATGTTAKTTANSLSASGESTSRLGFKGTEDLGNGTSAFFTAEFALYPQDTLSSGNTNGGLLNRQTFVGLKKNGIGQTAIGLQQTGIFNAVAVTDPGQMNNIAGNLVYASTAGLTNNNDGGATGIAFTNRISNAITFQTESFGGFRANALYTLSGKNSNEVLTTAATSGGNVNQSGWGLGADFTFQKFYAAAQYQAFKQLTTATNLTQAGANSAVFIQPQGQGAGSASTAAIAGAQGNNIQDNQTYIAATYDFGILKAYAQYINRKATSTASPNYYVKRQAEQIGVRSFITPTIEAWGSAGVGRYTSMSLQTAAATAQPTVNFNGWQLGSNYYLSKRTNLYAIYGQSLQSTGTYTNTSGVQYTGSGAVSNYAVGVRHTF